ncbi:MAG: hypothetical protein H6744_21890 [Deltaproteobacteria bacterium]|nr:hypothetical protein [Deltaproteobacteria bacterium]
MGGALILFVGPVEGEHRSAAEREIAAIAAAVGERLRLEAVWASSIEAVAGMILARRPAVVHFGAHAAVAGFPGPLAAQLAAANVAVVLLNACFEARAAEAMLALARCVVGSPASVGEAGAVAFAAGFYRELAEGASVAEAAVFGQRALERAGVALADRMRLLHRPEVYADANRVAPRPPPPSAPDAAAPGEPPRFAAPAPHLVAPLHFMSFSGRDEALAALDAWADDEAPVAVRLICGPAWVGKSWLALEWVRRRWGIGPDPAGVLAGPLTPEVVTALAGLPRADVVVERAELRADLGGLLAALAQRRADGTPGRLRLVLLARGLGDWWTALCASPGFGALLAEPPMVLERQGLADDPDDELVDLQRAVDVERSLARRRPGVFEAALAERLDRLGEGLADTGRLEGALAAIEEATSVWRGLASRNPEVYGSCLAMCLISLGKTLWELRRQEEALAATLEATAALRALASAHPGV